MLWKLLAAVVLVQPAQSIAPLYLPTLNVDIIDGGVAKGTRLHPRAHPA